MVFALIYVAPGTAEYGASAYKKDSIFKKIHDFTAASCLLLRTLSQALYQAVSLRMTFHRVASSSAERKRSLI